MIQFCGTGARGPSWQRLLSRCMSTDTRIPRSPNRSGLRWDPSASVTDLYEKGRHHPVDSVITSVILPGVGRVCPECLSRGHIPALRLSSGEVYSFGVTEPAGRLDWDVDAARALIAVRPRVAQRVDPEWLRMWLAERTTITVEHLDHIPPEKLDEPAIVVEVVERPPGYDPRPFRILIDGTHRLARRLRDGDDCWTYLLTEEEQASVCEYRVRGQVVEAPTLPGAGIGEREAGIILRSSALGDDVA